MTLTTKIAAGIFIAMSLALAFLWWRTEALNEELGAYKSAVIERNAKIEQLDTTIQNTRSMLENYQQEQALIKEETAKISKILAEHDLENLAKKRPGLIERKINTGTKKVLQDLEDSTRW